MNNNTTSPPGEVTEAAASDSSSGVAVLDRAFAILGAFGPTDERLTLTELSRRTAMYKSTVLRLLAALEHGGFIRKLEDGQYAIGPQPLRLAAIYQRSFRVGPVIEPLLEQVSRELGETASFYVRQGDRRLVLYRVERRARCASQSASGMSSPLIAAPRARYCWRSANPMMNAGAKCATACGRCHMVSASPRLRPLQFPF